METRPPLIAHVDMDAFFVSVERLLDPSLRGKPVLVGGRSARAVVSAASYEARKFGCRSAMPMRQAIQLCPEAVVLDGNSAAYRDYSHRVFAVLERLAPVVEPVSVDEAYLDLTGCEGLLGPPLAAAHRIHAEILKETGLVASVGLGTNRTIAKIASGLAKPDGLLWVPSGSEAAFLAPMSVDIMPGVGPAARSRLNGAGIFTLGDAARRTPAELERKLGTLGAWIHEKATGHGSAELEPNSESKSMGRETTFERDVKDMAELERVLATLAEDIGSRLRRHGVKARTVTVKIRDGKFRTITRAETLPSPTDTDDRITETARRLFRANWPRSRPVRLIGVTCSGLGRETPAQGGLFDPPTDMKARKIDGTLDQLRARFGGKAVVRGRTLRKK